MIELEGINRIYEGETYKIQALTDITLSIKEREFVSIMGKDDITQYYRLSGYPDKWPVSVRRRRCFASDK